MVITVGTISNVNDHMWFMVISVDQQNHFNALFMNTFDSYCPRTEWKLKL